MNTHTSAASEQPLRSELQSILELQRAAFATNINPDMALMAALREAPRGGLSADELAARLGRSRAWVFKRLQVHRTAGRAAVAIAAVAVITGFAAGLVHYTHVANAAVATTSA